MGKNALNFTSVSPGSKTLKSKCSLHYIKMCSPCMGSSAFLSSSEGAYGVRGEGLRCQSMCVELVAVSAWNNSGLTSLLCLSFLIFYEILVF